MCRLYLVRSDRFDGCCAAYVVLGVYVLGVVSSSAHGVSLAFNVAASTAVFAFFALAMLSFLGWVAYRKWAADSNQSSRKRKPGTPPAEAGTAPRVIVSSAAQ